jgi:alpha-glucoside transport system ATP-binding protein
MELYERPNNLFVAKFIGSPAMNIIPATIAATGDTTRLTLEGGSVVSVPIATPDSENGKKAHFGVRPEDLNITTGDDYLFEGEVAIVESLGEVTLFYIEGLSADEPIIAKVPGTSPIQRGTKIRFTADQGKLHIFNADGRSYQAH